MSMRDAGARAGAVRAAAVCREIEQAAQDVVQAEVDLGDIRVAREGDTIVLSGRRLLSRMFEDARLRGLTRPGGRHG